MLTFIMFHVLWAGIFFFTSAEFKRRFKPLKSFYYSNGLSLVVGLIFTLFWVTNESDGFSQAIGGIIFASFFVLLIIISGIVFLFQRKNKHTKT